MIPSSHDADLTSCSSEIVCCIEYFLNKKLASYLVLRFEFFTEFRYLVSIFTKDGRDTKNICHGITQARKIISGLNMVWWSKDVTKNRKKMIYNSMVKSVLIYGAEIWSLYEDDRRRINATETDREK